MSEANEVPQPESLPSEPPPADAQRSFLSEVAVLVTGETIYHGAPYVARVVTDKLTPPPGKHAAGHEQPPAGNGSGAES